jgi:ATP-dependent Lon protease
MATIFQPSREADEPDSGRIVISTDPGTLEPSGTNEEITIPSEVGVLPVRNLVLFPGMIVPLTVGREKSRRLLKDLLAHGKLLVTVCQKSPEIDDPRPQDLYTVGTAVVVLKLLSMPDGNQTVILQPIRRVKIDKWLATEPYLRAAVTPLSDRVGDGMESEALLVNVRNMGQRIVELAPNLPPEASLMLDAIDSPGRMADFMAANMDFEIAEKQYLLEELDVNQRLRTLTEALQHQIEVLELSDKIQEQVQASVDESQKQYFLQEQLKAIQKELGQGDDNAQEIEELRERIDAAGMTDPVREECLRELQRMERMSPASPDYTVTRTYLDWMTELPWSKSSEDNLDVNRAEKILNADHYGLEKVKRRILEFLSVRKLAPDSRGPILCFVGPPGVGKTSLGQSVARALGRSFIRMSLGGMRDEAELRGHRRTYIGAMPGRVVQEIRKAGIRNPVFMLDELDKVGMDFRGDPTSALLEILDPAQNFSFQDHYLNVPFDLSKVMFIATANVLSPIPGPLRDRMEVIELPGYTHREKRQIALRYLVGRQLEANGLTVQQAKWKESAIDCIIESYTRESGVRELERQIGSVCRSIAAMIARGKSRGRTVTPALVEQVLGPAQYESELSLRTSLPGVATGLAYTSVGGEILFIEATMFPGSGKLTLTGQIGDVMRESAEAAMSLLKSRVDRYGIDIETLRKHDIHVHVPAGATPKDGPSAGVSMFTALVSLVTDIPVCADVAMTGEITLRGLVMPIGGVKEKVLAARRAGVKTVLLPKRNEKDLVDIPQDAKDELEFVFTQDVDDVLRAALCERPGQLRLAEEKSAKRKSGGNSGKKK